MSVRSRGHFYAILAAMKKLIFILTSVVYLTLTPSSLAFAQLNIPSSNTNMPANTETTTEESTTTQDNTATRRVETSQAQTEQESLANPAPRRYFYNDWRVLAIIAILAALVIVVAVAISKRSRLKSSADL